MGSRWRRFLSRSTSWRNRPWSSISTNSIAICSRGFWCWALALLPLLVIVFFRNEKRRRVLLGKLIATRLQDRLAGTVSVVKRRWRFALVLLGLAALTVSVAQPRYGFTWQESKRRGR